MNDLDVKRKYMMIWAILKCRKFKAGKVPYSPYLSNLGSKIILLRLIIKKKIQMEKKKPITKNIKMNPEGSHLH